MPTKLDRVQVLFQKELFQKLKFIAKTERRSLSSMVSSIVEESIESEKYQSILSKAKANDLKLKIQESKSLIKDIIKSNISNQIDFDSNSKLKKLDEILSCISISTKTNSKKSLDDDGLEAHFLVDNVLEPNTSLEKLDLDTGEKITKLRSMLNKIKNIDVIN